MDDVIPRIPAKFLMSLNMNGMQGRMVHVPAPKGKTREILYVYGHHSSLERWWGLVQELNKYGAVTMPDLPGFGGMDTFYKIGQVPTLDNYADYLAAFIKLRFSNKKVTIAGLSFGFLVATRMLQRYPELVKKVDLLISVVGFTHREDFTFSKPRYFFYRCSSALVSLRLPAYIFRKLGLNSFVIRTIYRRTHNAKEKFANAKGEELQALLDIEVNLWQSNEVRTYMKTTTEFLTLDNCKVRIDMPVWHISVKADRYFSNELVRQHLQVIFSELHEAKSSLGTHAPSVIADAKTAAPFIPYKIRQQLNKKP